MMKGNKAGTLIPESLSTKLNRVAEMARRYPDFRFATIVHLITVEMLHMSFRQLRRDAAAGIDGVTVQEYEKDLERNLKDLHSRMKEGRYLAQPLRRIYIAKEDGQQRPLSIPALEDKIAQRAVVNLLSRIYENDFLPCSFGYRPKRSAHDAVRAIDRRITLTRMNYVLEVDIQDYFGSIVRKKLMEILQKRIVDKNLLRLIGKWLHVGVIEDGRLLMSEDGTYQGSVISPILANIYLHEVLDQWVEQTVKPRMRGDVELYRFSDDFILCFQNGDDAKRVLQVLPKRFEKFGLKLHPKKTKLIEFGYRVWKKSKQTEKKPATFDFLGFTFICGTTRKGKFSVKVKTRKKGLRRSIERVTEWCKRNRHVTVQDQWRHLQAVLRGHYLYYGRRSNYQSLAKFYRAVIWSWYKWLSRRGRVRMSKVKYSGLLKKYPLLKPYITEGRHGYQTALIGELV